MPLVDRCIFNSGVAGLNDFTVASAATGFLTPAQAGAVDASTYSYAAQTLDAFGNISAWEVGTGTCASSGTVIQRTTVVFSSAANAKVNFGSAPTVTLTPLETDILQVIVNDTNVTGALSGHTLTLGWTGTLALSRLAQGTSGQIIIGQGASSPLYRAMSGDATISSAGALTLASVISAGGPTGSATVAPIITYDAKGRLTTVSSATITPAASSITGGQALTKGDDTNVTLTLGGSASTALLAAASITAGWNGTLALSRLAQGTDGQIIVGQTSASPLYKTMSGDATLAAGGALTLASTITAGGPTGSATVAPIITYDAKGRLTTVTSATITPAVGSITGLGTGVATALAVNVGSAGAFVTFNGALGTPSSGTVTNLTGTASININGTVGATTATSGLFTTLGASGIVSLTNATDASALGTAAVVLTGGLSVAKQTIIGTTLLVNSTSNQSGSLIAARKGPGTSFEFGYDLATGYVSTLGADANGTAFLSLNCTLGTSATFTTYGLKGSIFLTDGSGGFNWATVPTATAANQTINSRMALTNAGVLTVLAGTSSTSSTTGVVVLTGGLGVSENLNVGGVSGHGTSSSTTTYSIFGASTTGVSSMRLPHGAAPSSPVNGDMWTTTSGLFVRINGSTVGPLS